MTRGTAGRRTLVVATAEAGQTVAALLGKHWRLSWSRTRRLIHDRLLLLDGALCLDPARRLRPGQRLQEHQPPSPKPHPKVKKKPARNRQPTSDNGPSIRHVDAHVVVVEKPVGLTTMRHPEDVAEFGPRARRFLPSTLADLLPDLLPSGPRQVRAVHRLDRDTSGLVVFVRTPEAERHLGRQFRDHTIERRYLAVVRGRAQPGRIESILVRDRGDGRRGSSASPHAGKRAVTHVRIVEDLGDFTLVECSLETGRTHQVRIHLAERGTPICGERVYDRPLHGSPIPDRSHAPRLALHAATLAIDHPATGKRLAWTSPLPEDLGTLLTRLRNIRKDHGTSDDGRM